MYSGRSQRDKDRLAEAITEDVVNILKVDKKDVIVVFQEASHGNWYAAGVSSLKITIRVKEDMSISLKNRIQFYYLN